MADVQELDALERLLRPLQRDLSEKLADALVRLEADHEVQDRYEQLAARNTEGNLTSQEREELDSLVRANSLLSVLKAEARLFLDRRKAT